MLLYYLLNHPYQCLLIPPALVWMFLSLKHEQTWRRLLWTAAGAAIALAGLLYLSGLPKVVEYPWSSNRLAWPMSWTLGHRLYYPQGEGPILTRLYGPGAAIAYLPAVTIASTPTGAVLIGSFINLLLFILPAVGFIYFATRGQTRVAMLGAAALFIILCARNPMLFYTSRMVTTDAPAIAMAACAAAILVAGAGRSPWQVGFLCAIAAAFSIWSKQTLAPFVFALMGYALLIGGWKWAMRFTLALGIGGLLISGIIIAAFGWNELYFNLITLPRGRPWRFNWLESYQPVLRTMRWIWRDAMPVGWIVLIAILMKQDIPRRASGGLKEWARRNPWLLPLMIALTVLPTGAYAYAQIGGQPNSAAPFGYFLLLSAAAALAGAWRTVPDVSVPLPPSMRLTRLGFVSILIACTFWFPADLIRIPGGFRAWPSIPSNDNQVAFHAMKEQPGQLYFPHYPLASMMAERRAFHHEDGIYCLKLVGITPSDEHFRAFLPEKFRAMIVPVVPGGVLAVGLMPQFKSLEPWDRIPSWYVLKWE